MIIFIMCTILQIPDKAMDVPEAAPEAPDASVDAAVPAVMKKPATNGPRVRIIGKKKP